MRTFVLSIALLLHAAASLGAGGGEYRLPVGWESIRATLLQDDHIVVVSGPATRRTVGTLSSDGRSAVLAVMNIAYPAGESLSIDDKGWWYAVLGNYRSQHGVTFVRPSTTGSVDIHFVPLESAAASVWKPLRASSPRGVAIQSRGDTVTVREVVPSGIAGSWSIPSPGQGLTSPTWSAERLLDGRLVVFRVDEANAAPIEAWILSGEGRVERRALPCPGRHASIATALGEDGDIGIAVETLAAAGRVIETSVFRADDAAVLPCQPLFGGDETGMWPSVAAVGDGFAVAWVDAVGAARHELKVQTFNRGALTGTRSSAGSLTGTPEDAPFHFQRAKGSNGVLLLWREGAVLNVRRPD